MSNNIKVVCPSCGAALTTQRQLQPGAKLRCPKCNSAFAMKPKTSAHIVASSPASSATPASESPQSVDAPNRNAMFVGVAAVLLLIAGVFAVVLLKSPAESTDQDSQFSQSNKESGKNVNPDAPEKDGKSELKAEPKPPTLPKKVEPKSEPPQPNPKPKLNPKPNPPLPKKPFPQGPPKQKKDDPVKKNPPIEPMPKDPPNETPVKNVGDGASLSKETLQKIKKAIERGVGYLKRTQNKAGTWTTQKKHEVGYAAFAGLTLLECDVPPDDPVVQRAAAFVRQRSLQAEYTYDVSISVLFLDRLGDLRDRPLIQTLALRVLASQSSVGGWSYLTRALSQKRLLQIYRILLEKRKVPAPYPDPFSQIQKNTGKGKPSFAANWEKLKQLPYPTIFAAKVLSKEASEQLAARYFTESPKSTKTVENPLKLRRDIGVDNSNTLFALLALWSARRHGIPSESAIKLTAERYVRTQLKSGGWAYNDYTKKSTGPMTGAGLLGLAMGLGITEHATDAKRDGDPSNQTRLQEPAILRGMAAFSEYINDDGDKQNAQRGENLYFVWTVERVAVLYDMDRINGLDWYRWGTGILLPTQQSDGSWNLGGYIGADTPINVCFALLFLKRVNLVQDLTENIRFFRVIENPNDKKPRR